MAFFGDQNLICSCCKWQNAAYGAFCIQCQSQTIPLEQPRGIPEELYYQCKCCGLTTFTPDRIITLIYECRHKVDYCKNCAHRHEYCPYDNRRLTNDSYMRLKTST
jgi:hypothetical protein